MKKTIATALVAVATLTGAASAMTPAGADAIRFYAGDADVSTLTPAEVNAILSIIHNGDSEGEKRNAVKAFLQ